MEFLGRKLSIYCLLLVLTSFLLSCSSEKRNHSQGTQDTGGGSAVYSTPEQVRAALDRAIDLVTRSNPNENVIAQFWIERGRKNNKSYIQNPIRLFPDLGTTQGDIDLRAAGMIDKFKSPVLQALKKNKIIHKEAGDCLRSSVGKHTDASVSAFNINADICFSIGNLTRIPPSALLKEVLSLALHEAIHLGGGSEEEAVEWQAQFSSYFGSRLGDVTADSTTALTFKSLSNAKLLIGRAKKLAEADVNSSHVHRMVGQVAQILADLPDVNDPLALEIKLNPKQPKLIGNYSNAVLALAERIVVQFEIQRDQIRIGKGTWRVPIVFMRPDQIPQVLGEYSMFLDQINENFLALVDDSSGARSVSIFPEFSPL